MPATRTKEDESSLARPGGGLGDVQLFEGFSDADLVRLEQMCTWRKCDNGDEILNRESENRDVFFVVKGKVRVVNYSLTGREVAYATVNEGGCFGEMAAIDGKPRSANIVALEPCVLASLSPKQFRQLMMDHPEVAIAVSEKLALIIRTADDRIMDLSTLGAHQRVYRELAKLISRDPVRANSWLIYPLPTQAQIAALASTTRETVARVLSQLTTEGIVERKGRTLYIRDRERLDLLTQLGDTDPDAVR